MLPQQPHVSLSEVNLVSCGIPVSCAEDVWKFWNFPEFLDYFSFAINKIYDMTTELDGLRFLLSRVFITIYDRYSKRLHPGAAYEWCKFMKVPYNKSHWKAQENKMHWQTREIAKKEIDRIWNKQSGFTGVESRQEKKSGQFYGNEPADVEYYRLLGVYSTETEREIEAISQVLVDIVPYLMRADNNELNRRRIATIHDILILERDLKITFLSSFRAIAAARAPPSSFGSQ